MNFVTGVPVHLHTNYSFHKHLEIYTQYNFKIIIILRLATECVNNSLSDIGENKFKKNCQLGVVVCARVQSQLGLRNEIKANWNYIGRPP